jgi:tRNA threonylcarbamoyladenosine biosynthesis protein TsaE
LLYPPISLNLTNAEATYNLGFRLGQRLAASSVLLLTGDLGSGKTSLSQGIGAGLGIDPREIASPTFTLIAEYLDGRLPFYHLDLYRLDPPGANQLHLESYWEGEEMEPGIMAIEWPDRLSYLPDRYLTLAIEHQGEGRKVTVSAQGENWNLNALLGE